MENTPSVSGSVLGYLECILQNFPDQRFTIDVRHTTFQDEADALLAHPYIWGNVKHIHISDYVGPPHDFASLGHFCPPGMGNVRFDRWFSFLKETRFTGSYTLESNCAGAHGIEDPEALKVWLDFIRANIA